MVDLQWLRDYGALVAASIAAIVALLNPLFDARRERQRKHLEWVRDLRQRCYVEFVNAAQEHAGAQFWAHVGDKYDETFHGQPQTLAAAEVETLERRFWRAFSQLCLVGPNEVVRAAAFVRYAIIWESRRLDDSHDPFRGDWAVQDTITDFVQVARDVLQLSFPRSEVPSYDEWAKAHRDERGGERRDPADPLALDLTDTASAAEERTARS